LASLNLLNSAAASDALHKSGLGLEETSRQNNSRTWKQALMLQRAPWLVRHPARLDILQLDRQVWTPHFGLQKQTI
jgi:hypothetical protein